MVFPGSYHAEETSVAEGGQQWVTRKSVKLPTTSEQEKGWQKMQFLLNWRVRVAICQTSPSAWREMVFEGVELYEISLQSDGRARDSEYVPSTVIKLASDRSSLDTWLQAWSGVVDGFCLFFGACLMLIIRESEKHVARRAEGYT